MVQITLSELSARVGAEIGVSDWLEVTQRAIDDFARVTHDLQWIHVDPARAAHESPFRNADGSGSTIAHGALTLSLLSHMMAGVVMVTDRHVAINVGFNRVRFTGPVPAGSRIRAHFKLGASDPIPGGARLVWNVNVEREHYARSVLIAEWLTRVMTESVPAG